MEFYRERLQILNDNVCVKKYAPAAVVKANCRAKEGILHSYQHLYAIISIFFEFKLLVKFAP
jgi:hypothetical protein